MNLFEFFVNLNHRKHDKGWCETKAVFTGNREKAALRGKAGYKIADYYSYEIKYIANGEERRGFYAFYPLPDPDVEEIKDTEMRIRYKKKKPYIFEQILDEEVESEDAEFYL